MAALLIAAMLVAGPSPTNEQETKPTSVLPIALGAVGGTLVGAAAGAGAGFVIVYGSERGGCFIGGCDAPLLVAIPLSVVLGAGCAAAGGVAGGFGASVLTR